MIDGCKSFVVISDDLKHDKFAVWSMLKRVIQHLKEVHGIEKIKIFSDGCAAQFKNRYTLRNISYFKYDFQVEAEWSFFASSHGKGAVDAIGGTVKRNVWRCQGKKNLSGQRQFILSGIYPMD